MTVWQHNYNQEEQDFQFNNKIQIFVYFVNDFDTNLEFKALQRDLAYDKRIVDYKSEKQNIFTVLL